MVTLVVGVALWVGLVTYAYAGHALARKMLDRYRVRQAQRELLDRIVREREPWWTVQ